MSRSVAFVLAYGEHADVFFPDTLLAELCARAIADGHRGALVRVYYDGRDPAGDADVRRRLIAWLAAREADVVVVDRLFDAAPLRAHCEAAPGREIVFVSRGESLDPPDGVWVVGADPGRTKTGATKRSPTIPELVHAFRRTLAALDEGRDPAEVPGVAQAREGRLVAAAPLEPAAALQPYAAEPSFDVISLREPPPLVRRTLFGNSGCPYSHDPLESSSHFVGVRLPGERALARLGCAFCSMGGDYEKQPDAMTVDRLVEQAVLWARHTPRLEEFVLNDQASLRYLATLIRRAAAAGVPPVRWLFAARADSFVKEVPKVEAAIAAAQEVGHVVEVYLSGFESFSDAELERYNKGLRARDLVAGVETMRALHRRHPDAFAYAKARGHSLILFSPWTTPEQLDESVRTMRSEGLGELFHELGRNRLRLYEDLPIYWAAARDGLLSDAWEDGDEGAGRRKGYNVEHPWRFHDRRTRAAWALSGLLRERLGTTAELPQLAAAVELAKRVDPDVDVAALLAGVEGGLERLRARMHALVAERPADGPPRGRSERAEPIEFRARCNNGCEACPNRDSWLDDAESALAERVDRARASGRAIVLAGREPTIHPAFARLVQLASGPERRRVGVVTNGRMFALPRFVALARRAGLTGASIKLFAPDPATADRIARVEGAHAQALQAFSELAKAGIEGRELRAPLHTHNLDRLPDYADLAQRLGATQLRVEAALDAVTLDRLDAAADALERLVERCVVLGVPIEASTLDSGTGRFEWVPLRVNDR